MLGSILSFTVVAALLTVTPGVDTMLVLSQGLRGGRRTAVACGLGIGTGLVIWATASVLGLSALLAASRVAYEVVRLLGAAYLVYVGARGLLMTWRRRAGSDDTTPQPPGDVRRSALAAYRRGIITNLLNPKVGVFYVALLPQFAPAGHRSAAVMMLLAGIHLTLAIAWLGGMAWLASRVLRALSAKVTTRLERVSGAVMIGLGLRLATQGN